MTPSEQISFLNDALSVMSQQLDGLRAKLKPVIRPETGTAPTDRTPKPGEDATFCERLEHTRGIVEALRFKVRLISDGVVL